MEDSMERVAKNCGKELGKCGGNAHKMKVGLTAANQ